MIIKVKTKKGFATESNKLISNNNNKYNFRIKRNELIDFVDYLKDNNVFEFKVQFEDDDSKTIELPNKPTAIQYYEYILQDKLYILKNEQDLDKFFNEIGFVDNANIYKMLYERICKITPEEEAEYLERYRAVKKGMYLYIFCQLYDVICYYDIMRNSLKEWLLKYHNDYRLYFKTGLSYSSFLKFLLKNTGKKYY